LEVGGFIVTLGGRGFIVTLGVGGFITILGRGFTFIITLISGDDDENEDEEKLESLRFNSKKTAVHCSIKQCKKFHLIYEQSLIF
jgi:hypothetical protein